MASNTLGLYSQASNTLATAFHNLSVQASGGGGGSQTLAQTLTYGNTTGGNDIIQTSGDALRSSANANLRLELDGSGSVIVEQTNFAGVGNPLMILQTNDNSTAGANVDFYTNNATPAPNDELVALNFYGNMNGLSGRQLYSSIRSEVADASGATAESIIDFTVRRSGTTTLPLRLHGNGIKPSAIRDNTESVGISGEILTCVGTSGQLVWKSAQKAPNQQVFAMNNNASFTFASLGSASTPNKIPIGGNTPVITAQNGFTLDTSNNRIVYNGISGERFLIQTSASLSSSASSNVAIELRQNVNPITQCRTNLTSASFVDLIDFNVLQLNNGDYLEWFCAYTIAGPSFTSASAVGMTGSTTKPFQISITQLLY